MSEVPTREPAECEVLHRLRRVAGASVGRRRDRVAACDALAMVDQFTYFR